MILLIVSRSERARAWMRRALDPAWEIDEASNGLEALKRARDDGDYDLVIADETTEPFGAFGLARELKILPEPPAVIVLLERTQDNWLAKWSGTDRWLTQPIDPFELVREDVAIAETAEAQTAGVERYPR